MEEIISKEKTESLLKTEGQVRGLALESHKKFILKERGEEDLKKLEEFLDELGRPKEYKDTKPMSFYPVGLEIVELLAIKQLFDFDDEKFKEIGDFGSKLSLILRIFMKYFVSIETLLLQAPKIWKKYYTIGDLEVKEYNKIQNQIVIKISNLNLHPLHCLHLAGYISSVVRMVVKKPVSCQEIKCAHKGDSCHEFLVRW